MDLGVAPARHHRGPHGKDAIRGGGAQGPLQRAGLHGLVGAVATPAGMAGFQGPQRLLERLLKAAADRHGLTHGFHRRGEHRRRAAELLKGEPGDLRDHVINRGLKAGRRGPGDVVEDFVEGVAHRQPGRNLGDRKARGLGRQRGRTAHPGIHLDHHHIAIGGVDGELDVAAAGIHSDFADDRNRLVAETLVFPIGEGLGGSHGDRITGVHPHGVKVFDAAHDHHVVGGVTHHLQLKLLPAEQGLLNQDLGYGAGLEAALADGPEFLGVVGNPSPRTAQGEGRANDAGVAADDLANGFRLFHGGGNARGADGHPNPGHRVLEEEPVFGLADRGQVGADQLHTVLVEGAVFGQGHRQVEGRLAAHGGQEGIGLL